MSNLFTPKIFPNRYICQVNDFVFKSKNNKGHQLFLDFRFPAESLRIFQIGNEDSIRPWIREGASFNYVDIIQVSRCNTTYFQIVVWHSLTPPARVPDKTVPAIPPELFPHFDV